MTVWVTFAGFTRSAVSGWFNVEYTQRLSFAVKIGEPCVAGDKEFGPKPRSINGGAPGRMD